MILSRIWTIVLALVAGACVYLASISVGQFNRSLGAAATEQTKSDSQTVNWSLQIDARRRLENLYRVSSSEVIRKSLLTSLGKDGVTGQVREDSRKALEEINGKYSAESRFSALFLIDRDGKVVASTGYPKANNAKNMELGGYAAAFDALHGFARDDTWVWGDQIFRVVARPVEVEVHQAPGGAVIGLTLVDSDFASSVAKRTRTNVLFFRGDKLIASAVGEEGGIDNTTLQGLGSDIAKLGEDKSFKEAGRSELRSSEDLSAMYMKLGGEAAEQQFGFGVARPRASIAGIGGILKNATESDKKGVNYALVLGIVFGGAILGLLFSFIEHTAPLRNFGREVARLRKGDIDAFQLARLRGVFRNFAQEINGGMDRIAEKGGSVIRKPANLESILGPVPAQPSMSAFSFPNADPSGKLPGPPTSGPLPASVPKLAAPPAFKPPPPKPALGITPPPSAPLSSAAESGQHPTFEEEEGDATRVGPAPAGLLSQASKSVPPPPNPGEANADLVEWQQVYNDFLQVKRECGEAVEGFTFEKFQVTLLKNRDALVARHQCKRVKFAVYKKDGRASLKATPLKD
jgi:hypothetical protein